MNLMGRMYCFTRGSSASVAPKRVSSWSSKKISPTHTTTDRKAPPMTAAVKNWLDAASFPGPLPRRVLRRTAPPIPISIPRLKMMFHSGAAMARAEVPSGPW